MALERTTQYPFDLARLVAAHLEQTLGGAPDESVLVRLFEVLYFASLRTDEGRQTLCTVNFVEAQSPTGGDPPPGCANRWIAFPFASPLPLDLRTLTKLARAADPEVASLNVFADDDGELHIWGLVDQEPRHGDQLVLTGGSDVQRPGLFQATISGSGRIGVYRNGTLLGSLAQDSLVEAHYDVLWSGPVHSLLADHLRQYVSEQHPQLSAECGAPHPAWLERELLLRWLNSLSRILVNVQQYRHGGGLVIVPRVGFDNSNVKYRIHYDRLSRAVVGLVRAHLLRTQTSAALIEAAKAEAPGTLYSTFSSLRTVHLELEQRKEEVLGCLRFIASLSCVDGVVLLDKSLSVHGFGVELRTDSNLGEVFMAGDADAKPARLRRVEITQFGTRHRAIMRYCFEHHGSLGFAISQDGGIQAVMRIGDQLVVWENIDVALALNAEDFSAASPRRSPILRWFGVRAYR
ncbi:MAG: hypothetical protein MUE50_19440 [Pirellulaceae bacterium]|jgi:hypothetical protein|nr:hypothetical protein [Pirellulaceae bacterium]